MDPNPIDLLLGSFHAALEALSADRLLPPLPEPPQGRTWVVGAGKAAAAFAAALESRWPSDTELDGLVITRHGHGLPTHRIQVREAGHPLPDAGGLIAAQDLLDRVAGARPGDRLIALISGGGSSLLSLPPAGLTLADLKGTSAALLASGAPIHDINIVRKHLSRTLGGRLAEHCQAEVDVWLLSDVAGDDPAVIASGPFAADPSTFTEALAVLDRWHVTPPKPVRNYLIKGASGHVDETPKPGNPCFDRVRHRILGSGRTMLLAAADWFRQRDIPAIVLGDTVSGEAREVAQVYAALIREVRIHASPWSPPVVLLSGGETSVTVRGKGKGGRNLEFLLALGLALDGLSGVHALAADSDGIDGQSEAAGAWLTPDSLARATALGLSARACLDMNDADGFFSTLGSRILTGPTRTNVNDFRAILIA